MTHSYIFFLIVMVILILARVVNVYVLGQLGKLVSRGKFTVCPQEMHVIFLSGMVRGAVPFVLFTSVSFTDDDRYSKNEGIVLKTTIIFIIVFTNVILNSIIPTIYKKNLKKLNEQYKQRLLNEVKKEKSKKILGKFRTFEEKYIKPFMIFDYVARKETIEEEKRLRHKKVEEMALIDD